MDEGCQMHHQNNEKTYQEDSDSSPAVFGNFGTEQDADTFTQEVRIDGTSDSLNWTVGGYYLEIEGDYRAFFQFPDYFGYGTFIRPTYLHAEYDRLRAQSYLESAKFHDSEQKVISVII